MLGVNSESVYQTRVTELDSVSCLSPLDIYKNVVRLELVLAIDYEGRITQLYQHTKYLLGKTSGGKFQSTVGCLMHMEICVEEDSLYSRISISLCF